MSKPKGKIVVEFELRDPDYLSDKYIKEFQKNIPFDMELVSLTNCKKVAVHRFVVMMFSKHIRNLFIDGGNSFKNGHVIIPVNVPYHILIKVIELFYDCRTTIPAHSVSDMNKALHILQVYNVMDFVGQMAPPIIIPNSGVRPMPVNVEPQLNRRQTMAYQPIMDPKRRCTNIVPTPQPMVRPLVAPIKVQPLTFEQARNKPVRRPIPAARNLVMVPMHNNESENDKNKLCDESNKILVEKLELPNEGDMNKENERPELNLDFDISKDEKFIDFMVGLENDIDLNY